MHLFPYFNPKEFRSNFQFMSLFARVPKVLKQVLFVKYSKCLCYLIFRMMLFLAFRLHCGVQLNFKRSWECKSFADSRYSKSRFLLRESSSCTHTWNPLREKRMFFVWCHQAEFNIAHKYRHRIKTLFE